MPMNLLAQLCAGRVPVEVLDQDDIEKLVVLRSAAFVDADIPPVLVLVEGGSCCYAGPAVVTRVTERGFAAAKACGPRTSKRKQAC